MARSRRDGWLARNLFVTSISASTAILLKGPGDDWVINNVSIDDVRIENQADEIDTTLCREFQPAPEGGWQNIPESERPSWWRPEGSVLPPKGAKIAIAFRGEYHRFSQIGFHHCGGPACSDYWASKDNIYNSIVRPLKVAGAQVRFYFHTYSDFHCQRYDDRLVNEMMPSKYKFNATLNDPADKRSWAGVGIVESYTYVEAMKLVIEDHWAEFALMVRFDVQYNAPITSWNLDWFKFNVPFEENDPQRGTSDLLFSFPRKFFDMFVDFLAGGASPWVAGYVKSKLGSSSVHEISPETGPSMNSLPGSFLGTVRDCSEDYHKC